MRFTKRKEEKKEFVCLATARHNARIKNIEYANKKITKPLFFIGLVLPDFKISWGILLVYLFVKYPISLKVMVKNWYNDKKTTLSLNLLVLKRRFL